MANRSNYYLVHNHTKEETEVLSQYDYFNNKADDLELLAENDNFYYLQHQLENLELFYSWA